MQTTSITKSRKILGTAAVITASLLFGLGYTFGSIIRAEGMSETCNALWTSLISITCNLLFCGVRRKNPFRRISKKQLLQCVLCGVCATWLCNVMFLVAYKYLTVAEATMLHFLHPSMIAVFMTVCFREKFTRAKLAAIVSSIVGMLLITGGCQANSLTGIAAALATGILYAVYPVMLETTSLREVDSSTVVLYMNIFGALSSAVVSLSNGTFMLPNTPTVFVCDVIIAVTGVTAYLLTGYGVRIIGATNASFGSMLEPIASCVFAAVVLSQPLERNVLFGAFFIVLSILFTSVQDLPGKHRTGACTKSL